MRTKMNHLITLGPTTLLCLLSLLVTMSWSTPALAAVENRTDNSQLVHHVSKTPAGRASAGRAHRIVGRGKGTRHPLPLSASERLKQQEMVRKMHPALRPTPVGTTIVPHPSQVAASVLSPALHLKQVSPQAPVSIISTDLGVQHTIDIDEPSVASDGTNELQTWNRYSAISTDGGTTWTYYDPSTLFSNDYGGWCCDSVTIYAGSRNLFLWNLLYYPDANTGAFRLAVANGVSDLSTASFHYWDLTPQQTNGGVGDWYDFPVIAISNNFAYLQTNVFHAGANTSYETLVMRFALDDLTGQGSLGYRYLQTNGVSSVAFTNGATSTMYFAGHLSTSKLRVFHWDENSTSYGWDDVDHVSYPAANEGDYSCPRTGVANSNWCARSDDRLLSGWLSNGIIAFSWNAAQGQWGFNGSAPYPYTDIVRIDEATKAHVDDPIVWNSDYAYQYMAFYPNGNGDIGGTYISGGGSLYEVSGVNIWDGQGRDFVYYVESTQDTTEAGDYLAARPLGNSWVGTGYALLNDGTHPYNVVFGR